jgi:hypothetical protein
MKANLKAVVAIFAALAFLFAGAYVASDQDEVVAVEPTVIDHDITISEGETFTLAGNVTILDGVMITIADGGMFSVDGSVGFQLTATDAAFYFKEGSGFEIAVAADVNIYAHDFEEDFLLQVDGGVNLSKIVYDITEEQIVLEAQIDVTDDTVLAAEGLVLEIDETTVALAVTIKGDYLDAIDAFLMGDLSALNDLSLFMSLNCGISTDGFIATQMGETKFALGETSVSFSIGLTTPAYSGNEKLEAEISGNGYIKLDFGELILSIQNSSSFLLTIDNLDEGVDWSEFWTLKDVDYSYTGTQTTIVSLSSETDNFEIDDCTWTIIDIVTAEKWTENQELVIDKFRYFNDGLAHTVEDVKLTETKEMEVTGIHEIMSVYNIMNMVDYMLHPPVIEQPASINDEFLDAVLVTWADEDEKQEAAELVDLIVEFMPEEAQYYFAYSFVYIVRCYVAAGESIIDNFQDVKDGLGEDADFGDYLAGISADIMRVCFNYTAGSISATYTHEDTASIGSFTVEGEAGKFAITGITYLDDEDETSFSVEKMTANLGDNSLDFNGMSYDVKITDDKATIDRSVGSLVIKTSMVDATYAGTTYNAVYTEDGRTVKKTVGKIEFSGDLIQGTYAGSSKEIKETVDKYERTRVSGALDLTISTPENILHIISPTVTTKKIVEDGNYERSRKTTGDATVKVSSYEGSTILLVSMQGIDYQSTYKLGDALEYESKEKFDKFDVMLPGFSHTISGFEESEDAYVYLGQLSDYIDMDAIQDILDTDFSEIFYIDISQFVDIYESVDWTKLIEGFNPEEFDKAIEQIANIDWAEVFYVDYEALDEAIENIDWSEIIIVDTTQIQEVIDSIDLTKIFTNLTQEQIDGIIAAFDGINFIELIEGTNVAKVKEIVDTLEAVPFDEVFRFDEEAFIAALADIDWSEIAGVDFSPVTEVIENIDWTTVFTNYSQEELDDIAEHIAAEPWDTVVITDFSELQELIDTYDWEDFITNFSEEKLQDLINRLEALNWDTMVVIDTDAAAVVIQDIMDYVDMDRLAAGFSPEGAQAVIDQFEAIDWSEVFYFDCDALEEALADIDWSTIFIVDLTPYEQIIDAIDWTEVFTTLTEEQVEAIADAFEGIDLIDTIMSIDIMEVDRIITDFENIDWSQVIVFDEDAFIAAIEAIDWSTIFVYDPSIVMEVLEVEIDWTKVFEGCTQEEIVDIIEQIVNIDWSEVFVFNEEKYQEFIDKLDFNKIFPMDFSVIDISFSNVQSFDTMDLYSNGIFVNVTDYEIGYGCGLKDLEIEAGAWITAGEIAVTAENIEVVVSDVDVTATLDDNGVKAVAKCSASLTSYPNGQEFLVVAFDDVEAVYTFDGETQDYSLTSDFNFTKQGVNYDFGNITYDGVFINSDLLKISGTYFGSSNPYAVNSVKGEVKGVRYSPIFDTAEFDSVDIQLKTRNGGTLNYTSTTQGEVETIAMNVVGDVWVSEVFGYGTPLGAFLLNGNYEVDITVTGSGRLISSSGFYPDECVGFIGPSYVTDGEVEIDGLVLEIETYGAIFGFVAGTNGAYSLYALPGYTLNPQTFEGFTYYDDGHIVLSPSILAAGGGTLTAYADGNNYVLTFDGEKIDVAYGEVLNRAVSDGTVRIADKHGDTVGNIQDGIWIYQYDVVGDLELKTITGEFVDVVYGQDNKVDSEDFYFIFPEEGSARFTLPNGVIVYVLHATPGEKVTVGVEKISYGKYTGYEINSNVPITVFVPVKGEQSALYHEVNGGIAKIETAYLEMNDEKYVVAALDSYSPYIVSNDGTVPTPHSHSDPTSEGINYIYVIILVIIVVAALVAIFGIGKKKKD